MVLELAGSLSTLTEDVSMVERLNAQRMKMRKDDLRVLQRCVNDVLKLRTAVMTQLDQLVNVEMPAAAAQPWAVSGFGGRFLRAMMELPETRPTRSYRSQLLGDLDVDSDNDSQQDPQHNEAKEIRELAELEELERSTRAPPPAGFMTDIISQRYYALMSQQTAHNQQQRLGVPVIDAMAALSSGAPQ